MNRPREFFDRVTRNASLGGNPLQREWLHEVDKLVEARRVRINKPPIDPAARCCVACIEVSVARGSMTMISGRFGFLTIRCHMIGWAMHRLLPTSTITSDCSKSA